MFPDGKISKSFRYVEFFTKDGTPIPIKAVPGLQRHIKRFLEPMRAEFGPCTVTSGYRHARYNASIGGASDSQHVWDKHPNGVATDVHFARGNPAAWARKARELRGRGGGGVGQYNGSGFVHIDSRSSKADWSG